MWKFTALLALRSGGVKISLNFFTPLNNRVLLAKKQFSEKLEAWKKVLRSRCEGLGRERASESLMGD